MRRTLFLIALLCGIHQFVDAQLEKKHIYEHSNQLLLGADIFLANDVESIVQLQGDFSSIGMVDASLFSTWSFDLNNLTTLAHSKTNRRQKVNFTYKDSVYVFGSEMKIGESESLAIILVNFNHSGDTTSTIKLRFDRNYLFRDMIFDGLNHYVIGTDGFSSFFMKLNEQDSVVWAHKYDYSINDGIIFKNLIQDSDTTFLIQAEEFVNEVSGEILIQTDKNGELLWSKKITDHASVPHDVVQYKNQIFTLSQDNQNFNINLNIINEIDSLNKTYSSWAEFSENMNKAFHIIHVNDSMLYFTSSLNIYHFNYLTGNVKKNFSYLDFINTAYNESTNEFYLLNKVGQFPVLSFSDIQSVGLLQGTGLESLQDNCDLFCMHNEDGELIAEQYVESSINLTQDSLPYEYINLPIELNYIPWKEKEGCLDPGNSIFEESLSTFIKISPNPSSGNLSILNEMGIIDEVLVFDALGQLILKKDGNGSEQMELLLHEKTGIYFITVISDKRRATKKVMIK